MKTKGARQSGNIEDRRGQYYNPSGPAGATDATRKARQFERLRAAKGYPDRVPDSPSIRTATDRAARAAIVRTAPKSPVPFEWHKPNVPESLRRPNARPRRIPGTGR